MPATRHPSVRVRGLRKSYGPLEAVQGIDFDVREGEVFALLGPNGAGKTTTVEILEGYRERSSGEVAVLGVDPGSGDPRLRARVGIMLQSSGLERYLTALEVVRQYAGYYPRPRPAEELLALVGLGGQAGTRVGRLSGGQRRRLELAVALAGDPDVVFLDEPTTGFDPSARRDAWGIVRDLAAMGKTVLLTTHYMDEAEALADRLAVLVGGRIVAGGSPGEVIGRHTAETVVRVRPAPGTPLPPAWLGLSAEGGDAGWLSGRTSEPTAFLHGLTGWALQADAPFAEVAVAKPSLEEVYLALTGHHQDEAVARADPEDEDRPGRGEGRAGWSARGEGGARDREAGR